MRGDTPSLSMFCRADGADYHIDDKASVS